MQDCAQNISDACPSYTFDENSFGMAPEIFNVTLVEGNSCYITINRTQEGSYGTVSIKTDDPYLLVFDDEVAIYESKELLGLKEVNNYEGWEPRTIFLANIGLVPSEFQVAFDSAMSLIASVGLVSILATQV